MRGGMRGGRRQGVGRRRRMQRAGEGLTRDQGRGTRGAHIEHGSHARDLRRIKAAKRLVEHMRGLPSHNTAGGRTMRSEVRAGRRKSVHVGWLRRRRTGVHGEQGPTQGWGGQVTSGAHVKHEAHVRDRGGVEVAERLVE